MSDAILTPESYAQYFSGCVALTREGKILCADGIVRNRTNFNMEYGGKLFSLGHGKTTTDAWRGATQSTMWAIPKVATHRAVPSRPNREIFIHMGVSCINTHRP